MLEGGLNRSMEADRLDRREHRRLRLLPRLMRSLRKRYVRIVHGDDYFIASYFGAKFLVRWQDIVAREIALQNFDAPQLRYMIDVCESFQPELFIDIGANSGLYSCVLLRRGLVPRAILFEPDRRNFAHLQANILINDLAAVADCYSMAAAAETGRLRLVPGGESNTGTSKIALDGAGGYDVDAVRIDGMVDLSGAVIAVKVDVEGFEMQTLAGMRRTLRDNRGIVQIETTTTRADVVAFMADQGFQQTAGFYSDVVFEKR